MPAGLQVQPYFPAIDMIAAGCVGDGSTDDLAKINAQITAHPSGILFFAPGFNFYTSTAPNWGSFTGSCLTAGARFSGSGASSFVPYYSDTRSGSVSGVPADGSAERAVSFASPFLMGVLAIVATAYNGTGTGSSILDVQTDHASTTGFAVYVAGGAPGATVTVHYVAKGT